MTWSLTKKQVKFFIVLVFIVSKVFLSKHVASLYNVPTTSIFSAHVTTKSPIIVLTYLSIFQAHVPRFQIYLFSYTWRFIGFLHSHQHNFLFHF